jgi:hypothetical protein
MKTIILYIKKTTVCLILFGLVGFVSLKAQSNAHFSVYVDTGENNASDGFFVKTSGIGSYQFRKTRLEGGCQFDLKSRSTNTLTGSTLMVSREFLIKEFSFEAQGLFMYNSFSKFVHESNWAIVFKTHFQHFSYKLGVNFRTFKVTKKAISDFDIDKNKSLHEKWNLMYLVRYNLKPSNYKWNIGISLTNIDHFIINQETNPEFYLHGKYDLTKKLTLLTEVWYKSAGALNISVNYFGFFVRTGIIWKIDLNT